jgi:hypothetical protein
VLNTGNDLSQYLQELAILTSGTTTVSEGSKISSAYIFAGTSLTNEPALQFLGQNGATDTYSVDSLIAGYGAVELGFQTDVNVTDGAQVLFGQLGIGQGIGSVLTLDGNSMVNAGGTLVDDGGGFSAGAALQLDGTITVGAVGSNNLTLSDIAEVVGNGTIVQTGKNDVTNVGAVGTGVHFDIQSGELTIGSSVGSFGGTIGPVNGQGPALGSTASIAFYPAEFATSQLQSVKFDTSTGVLSFLGASGQDLTDWHFSGNARGLDVSVQTYTYQPGVTGSYISITDHPGSISPIPITFVT